MSYKPSPRDTSSVVLPEALTALAETLSRNTHEVWSARRIAEGWSHGHERNDTLKTTPNLIEYDQLDETEKAYDRATALETLNLIVSLGFQIIEPEAKAKPRTKEEKALLPAWQQRIDDIQPLSIERLLDLWTDTGLAGHFNGEADAYMQLGKKLLSRDKPLIGIHVAISGIKRTPGHHGLRHLLALGLARSGAARNAQDVLDALLLEDINPLIRVETLSCYGRTYKDLWHRTQDTRRKRDYLELAFHKYREAYETDRSYYPAINTATLALLRDDMGAAASLASAVVEECTELLDRDGANYWLLATLGEARLILGHTAQALEHYEAAAALGDGNYAELDTTRQQALMIVRSRAMSVELANRIRAIFAVPPVILFAGHAIDDPGRAQHRFPSHLEEPVRNAIRGRLNDLNAAFGYSSAASGADMLFIEEMHERVQSGNQINVILPCSKEQFEHHALGSTSDWQERFRRICREIAPPRLYGEPNSSAFAVADKYANLIMTGLARLQARRLNTDLVPMVVWDGVEDGGPGGTAWLVNFWRQAGLEPEVIPLQDIQAALGLETTNDVTGDAPEASAVSDESYPTHVADEQAIKAILFADVTGYSKLTEEQIPLFVEHFLTPAAGLLGQGAHAPLVSNTWGDALYLVFNEVLDAGRVALRLRNWMRNTDWLQLGLPETLNVRIALHAGLVYPCYDPVIKTDTFVGSHVSWAARIEPITPKGEVYASEPFAAIAAAEGVTDFECDYVGAVPLAKDYGEFVLYHVHGAGS